MTSQDTIDTIRLEAGINAARNEALSYYNTNCQAIAEASLRAIEAFQIRQVRSLARELADRPRPIRVCFLLPEIALWDVYRPIYDAMARSEQFEPFVIAFLRTDVVSEKTPDEIVTLLGAMGVNFEFIVPEGGFYPQLAAFEPDVVFYTLGTVAYPAAYRIEFVSHFCLTSYLSYGFLMVNELEYQFGQSFHHAAWRIFASTDREQAEYAARSKRLTNNIVTTGYTKFDCYPADIPAPPERPRIIWAPHWTVGLVYPALNLGSFADICMPMLDFMRKRSDIDFVFKPHPNLRYACEKTSFMNEAAYNVYLDMLRALPNVEVAFDGDNIERFLASSAMITDSVSFLAEYIPSGRPLLFLERPDRAKFCDSGERIIAAHYRGHGMGPIAAFIDNVAGGHDPMAEARRQTASEELNIGDVTATQKLIDNILTSLKADPAQDRNT